MFSCNWTVVYISGLASGLYWWKMTEYSFPIVDVAMTMTIMVVVYVVEFSLVGLFLWVVFNYGIPSGFF